MTEPQTPPQFTEAQVREMLRVASEASGQPARVEVTKAPTSTFNAVFAVAFWLFAALLLVATMS